MKKITTSLLSLSALLIAGQAQAADDSVSINVTHPQSISVSSPSDASGNAGDLMSINWTITSNNGFDVAFSGTSHNEAGGTVNHPNFDKQDVDASGTPVPNNYDILDTRWGVVVTGAESTQTGTQWGSASNPTANDAAQGGDLLVGSGPDAAIGTIMTGDNTGTANVELYARGTTTDGAVQSGSYSATVVLTVSADEKLAAAATGGNSCTEEFCANGDGTVTHGATGLILLVNSNCFGTKNWDSAMSAAAGLANGACGLSDGSSASDWRLPTFPGTTYGYLNGQNSPSIVGQAGELEILYAAKTNAAFSVAQSSNYWSATTYAASTGYAWYVPLGNGYVSTSGKSNSLYVWPVRGGQ